MRKLTADRPQQELHHIYYVYHTHTVWLQWFRKPWVCVFRYSTKILHKSAMIAQKRRKIRKVLLKVLFFGVTTLKAIDVKILFTRKWDHVKGTSSWVDLVTSVIRDKESLQIFQSTLDQKTLKATETSPTHLFMRFIRVLSIVLVRWFTSGWVRGFRLRCVCVRFVLKLKRARESLETLAWFVHRLRYLLIVHWTEKIVTIQAHSLRLWAGR